MYIVEESNLKIKCPECGGFVINHTYEYVCEKCGLVLNDLSLVESYQMNETKDTEISSNAQFVSVGKVVDNVCNLGSHLGFYSNKVFYDYKGDMISADQQRKFRKLKNWYCLPLTIKDHETDYRILKILSNVSQYMKLTSIVKNRAAYFYQKIKKNAAIIRNHVSLIAFCIFYSSREFSQNAPIGIRELCTIFQELGHRINPRLIIRDSIEYQSIIKEKNNPHKSEDYIIRLVNAITNYPPIVNRMKKKSSTWNIDEYKDKLLKKSLDILRLMVPRIRGSRNPFILAGAVVYCADKILAKKHNSKSILTQKVASDAMEIAEYSIRDHYVKILKPFVLLKNNLKYLLS